MGQRILLCGLYQTLTPIRVTSNKGPSEIGAGLLVQLHNHKEPPKPILQLPEKNLHNRWTFFKQALLIEEPNYEQALRELKTEGFYRLKEHFHLNEAQIIEKNALVQLGYTNKAEPILFCPKGLRDLNGLGFPRSGIHISDDVYQLLEALSIRGPIIPQKEKLH